MIPPDAYPPAPRIDRWCDICAEPLTPWRDRRCDACTIAAWQAIRKAAGRTVLPSDIARERGLVE